MDRIRDSGSPYTVGLEFLDDMKNDELEVLVRIIIDKGGFSEELTDDADYQRYHPDHQKYTQRIAYEFVAFGNDTFRVFSDWKYYKDVLCDVCDQMDVPFNRSRSLEHIEHNLLEVVLEKTWEEMCDDDKRAMLNSIGKDNMPVTQATSAMLIGIFRAKGFASYQIAVSIVNVIAKTFAGRGLSLAANATLTRALNILSGPIGWALTALWTAWDLAGPAYRVTVPGCIYIAAMRAVYQNEEAKNFIFR